MDARARRRGSSQTDDAAGPGRGSGRITWLGHASVLVDLDGVRLLTDPLLATRVAHLRRVVPRPAEPEGVDAVLLSHLHRDHAHLPSLRRTAGGRLVLAPVSSAALLARAGAAEVIEMAAGDRARVGALEVRAVHAEHDGRRGPGSPPASALGYVVSGSRRVYFAGDTDLFPAMADLAPGLDVALLPIWGWGPTLGAGHLDPLRAAQALTMLRPRLALGDVRSRRDVEGVPQVVPRPPAARLRARRPAAGPGRAGVRAGAGRIDGDGAGVTPGMAVRPSPSSPQAPMGSCTLANGPAASADDNRGIDREINKEALWRSARSTS
jgi:L-ascorbate metabolism protein UlaG (beta-lactamase superfamily)